MKTPTYSIAHDKIIGQQTILMDGQPCSIEQAVEKLNTMSRTLAEFRFFINELSDNTSDLAARTSDLISTTETTTEPPLDYCSKIANQITKLVAGG